MPDALPLGELEQLVLLAILKLDRDAYGVGIARALETDIGRSVSRGAMYTTLDRLERKGLVRARVSPGGDDRARLPRRIYALTALGAVSIRASQRALRTMTRGLEEFFKDAKS